MRAALPILFAFLSSAAPVFGWGCEGHQTIALIARDHLTDAAAAAVDQLLSRNPIDPSLKRFCQDRPADSMADASTWADDVKNAEKTGVWHYIDIPLTLNGRTSLAPWCPPIGPPPTGASGDGQDRPGCITDALEYEQSILRDRTRSGADRATALRYVIHFVGDIHQPLHDSDNNDRGGNCTALKFFSEDRPANLHAIWDYKIIERELSNRRMTQAEYARMLARKFLSQSSGWIKTTSPEDWAWEGYLLAKSVTYGDLKPPVPFEMPDPRIGCDAERDQVAALHIAIGDQYFVAAFPVIDEQLGRAGYRLAALLNQILQ